MEKVRTLLRTDRHLGIKMVTEELSMEKEMARQILTTNLNMEKVCAKMVPKNTPVFSHKTNANAGIRSVLTSLPRVTFFLFLKLKSSHKGTHFQSTEDIHKKTGVFLKALSQNDFRRCFEAWKA